MQDKQKYDNDTTIHVIAERVNSVQNSLVDLKDEIRDSMKEISAAVTKLVQMEERQIHMNHSTEELRLNFKELETRVDVLEKDTPMNKKVQSWVTKAVWACVMAVGYFIAKSVGLM